MRIARYCTIAVTLAGMAASAVGATWTPTTGGSWADPLNWDTLAVPDAVGAAVVFSAINTEQRTVTNDSGSGSTFTVGSIEFHATPSTAFGNSLTAGAAGSKLTIDNGGAGAVIATSGTGTGNHSISVPLILNDSLTAVVNQTSASSQAGSLNLTAQISGSGGFTKQGPGTATFGTGAKTYTGPTVLDVDSGRMRMSAAGHPSATSSMTVRSGAQLTLISDGTYTFGPGSLHLNGEGLGPDSTPGDFPGAIRNDTSTMAAITNNVVLDSDSLIHVQGAASGVTTLSGNVSGPGGLTLSGLNSNHNLGTLVLSGANTYQGGTTVRGGTIDVTGGSATLGTGHVTIENSSVLTNQTGINLAVAKLIIRAGVQNAIADTAVLSIAGGGTGAGTAQNGSLEIYATETVGGLVLGGIVQTVAGTYGAVGSGASVLESDEFFAGPGLIQIGPAASNNADFDDDGDVDGADFLIWQRGIGLSGQSTKATGDATGDGVVNGADLAKWRTSFGGTPAAIAAGAVPEPGAAGLAVLAAAGLLRRRREVRGRGLGPRLQSTKHPRG